MRASNLKVLENPLSTHVYGDYDEVMSVLTFEIKEAFELIERSLLYMKSPLTVLQTITNEDKEIP